MWIVNKRTAKTIGVLEIVRMFDAETKAVNFFEKVQWNGKPICSHCKSTNKITTAKSKKFTYWCGECRNHFTVKTGTVMQSSKIDTVKWIIIIYFVLTARKGISSLELSKELGLCCKGLGRPVKKVILNYQESLR